MKKPQRNGQSFAYFYIRNQPHPQLPDLSPLSSAGLPHVGQSSPYTFSDSIKQYDDSSSFPHTPEYEAILINYLIKLIANLHI